MNKKQLIEMLKDYPEDTEIALWRWTEDGSKWFYLNPCCTNDPIKKRFDILISSEFKPVLDRITQE